MHALIATAQSSASPKWQCKTLRQCDALDILCKADILGCVLFFVGSVHLLCKLEACLVSNCYLGRFSKLGSVL